MPGYETSLGEESDFKDFPENTRFYVRKTEKLLLVSG